MTNPNDANLKSAYFKRARTRFRVEVSHESHHALRKMSLQQGKPIKDLAEEILQGYFQGNSSLRDDFEETADRVREE